MEDEPLNIERLLYPSTEKDAKLKVKIYCPFTGKEITGFKSKIEITLTFNGYLILDYEGIEHSIDITQSMINESSLPVPDYYSSKIIPLVNIIITRITIKSPYIDKSFSIELKPDKGWKYKDLKFLNIAELYPGKYKLDGYYSLKFKEYHGDLKIKLTKIRTLKKLLKKVQYLAYLHYDIDENELQYKNEFYGTATLE
ncbi:MAG: hypothetical protein A2475_02580 [Ignavibacteria bacterium RIFOXYC2_FULL_35_21]|nr:MAG: hypothetical protein A2220_00095 [Ignavibacteria bacterium RIFOXYA2_FULL_35_10]OGV19322.1 MAG: hypothetical protein A2475_02580 [Ignavibacteria bacterium RIFOXYC2_FULL_35_21]